MWGYATPQPIVDISGREYANDCIERPPGFRITFLSCTYCNDGDRIDMKTNPSERQVSRWMDKHSECKTNWEKGKIIPNKPVWQRQR